ncbi:hypothetical protein AX14_001542, partial [Amanita brunnescens Koide BX004]
LCDSIQVHCIADAKHAPSLLPDGNALCRRISVCHFQIFRLVRALRKHHWLPLRAYLPSLSSMATEVLRDEILVCMSLIATTASAGSALLPFVLE